MPTDGSTKKRNGNYNSLNELFNHIINNLTTIAEYCKITFAIYVIYRAYFSHPIVYLCYVLSSNFIIHVYHMSIKYIYAKQTITIVSNSSVNVLQ